MCRWKIGGGDDEKAYKKHLDHARGSLYFSLGINYFAVPNKLGEGGFTGIALLADYLFGFSPGLVIFILNIPLYFIGYRVFGKQTLIYTIIGTNAVSFFLWLTEGWGIHCPVTRSSLPSIPACW